MLFYILSIGLSMLTIMAFNLIFNGFGLEWWYIVLAVVVNTVAVIAVDGLFATIIRRCFSSKLFDYEAKGFDVSKKECRFYEKLGIKKWKDKVIELGCFTSFSKSEVKDPNDPEYIKRFILEVNYGAVIHMVCIIIGFVIVFFYPLQYFYMFGIPVAFVNAVLNLLPLFILRYNTPRLKTLLKLNLRKQQRTETKIVVDTETVNIAN